MSDSNAADVLGARYFVYMLLQSIFGVEPSEGQLEVLLGEDALEAFSLAGSDPEYHDAVEAFVAFVREHGFDESLKADYTRLFIGPGKPIAPPWESVYVNDEPLLFVESTIDVRKAYLDQGYAPKLFPHVADDHISLELDFMKRLSENACEALESGNRDSTIGYLSASKAFLGEHLQKWVDRFSGDVAQGAPGYYELAARVLATYVGHDGTTIDSIVLGE